MKPLSKSQRKQHPVLFGVPRIAPILQHLLELKQILESSSRVFNQLEVPPEVFRGDNGSLVMSQDRVEYFLQRSNNATSS